MVDPQSKRPSTPEDIEDLGVSFGFSRDNRLQTYRDLPLRESRDREDHGGNDDRRKTGEEREDDPHSSAAMALTVFSSGMRDLERRDHSEIAQQQFAAGYCIEKSQLERNNQNSVPSYSEFSQCGTQETLANLARTQNKARQQKQQQQQQQQQRPRTSYIPLTTTLTPSSSSSALNTSTLTVSKSTSPAMALDDLTLQDATIAYPEQNFTHAPVERMQSLSHMLKDRLTLATFRTDHGWDVDMDLAEKRLTISSSKYPSKDSWQQYPKYYSKHSPRSDDLSILSGKFTREGPITVTPLVPSKVFERDFEKSNQQSLVDSHENDSYQSQDFQSNYPQYHHQQRQGQLRLRSQSSGSTRENRDLLDWTTQISSPALDSSIIKPKRKYIKKSTLLSQATTERYSQSKFQPKRESNELLYSDRGLILKTQIPKKGRPISKHSTNSPQCTTISTSLSNLPTSQLYIAKSNSASSTSLTISTATSNRHSVDSLPHREYQISTFESQTNHDIPLTGRRLGRPLSNTLSRNVHSQSYTGTFSSSSSRSQNEQTQPISNPTSHEFDRNSSQYSNRHEQGSDNSRLLPCRGRSPTFSVMTTVSPSQHPSRQLGDQNDQSMPSSHHQYTASPIDQQFSVEELGVHEEDSKSGHLDQRYRSAGNISALPHRSFTEGIPTKLNTLKRSSSGMQKSLSMDGCHVRSIDARRRLSTNDGGSANRERGESDPMSYDSKERCEKIDKFGSKFSDNGYDDDTTFDMRSRKRISGSDLNRVERGDSCDGGSGIKRIHHGSHSSKDNSWHEMNLKGDHRRPQSLVLLREFMESEMAQTMATSVPEARPKSEYMRRIMSGDQRYIDSYDNRKMTVVTPITASDPSAAVIPSNTKDLFLMYDDGVPMEKGRGGHWTHSHARSLDITFSPSYRGHHGNNRTSLSPTNIIHPSQYENSNTKILHSGREILLTGRHIHKSLNFSSFDDAILPLEDSRDYDGYTPKTQTVVTKADILAREMSGTDSGSSITSGSRDSGNGRGRGRGDFTLSHPHRPLKAAVTKRSISKRGPGPHLKKHQILQQQLHQMQREQEESDRRLAIHHQQQRHKLIQQQSRRQQQVKQQQCHEGQQHHQAHSLRHQHSHGHQHKHHLQQEHLHQPQQGRPTKQRVLLRSESALAIMHGPHSHPRLSSILQNQSKPSLPQSIPISTSQSMSSRRRQSQQQPILLHPVSLSSLPRNSIGNAHGSSRAGKADFETSLPYLMNHPPPGQPLYRSLHTPYLVSPSSLISVASNSSSSNTGIEATLSGNGQGHITERREDNDKGDEVKGSKSPSPIKSPHATYSTSPPYGHHDDLDYPAEQHRNYAMNLYHSQHQQGHRRQSYQRSPHNYSVSASSSNTTIYQADNRSPYTGTMSRSSSRGGSGMSASSSSSTLVQSSTSHSFSQYHHRHSSSLPSFNFYHRNSSPTSPKYSDQSQQLQQQQYAECASNPISNLHQTSDPTRPPIHRMLSHDTVLSHKPISTSISPKSQSYYSVSALPLPPPSSSSSFPTTMATATAGTIATGEECVEQHLMQTPLGDV